MGRTKNRNARCSLPSFYNTAIRGSVDRDIIDEEQTSASVAAAGNDHSAEETNKDSTVTATKDSCTHSDSTRRLRGTPSPYATVGRNVGDESDVEVSDSAAANDIAGAVEVDECDHRDLVVDNCDKRKHQPRVQILRKGSQVETDLVPQNISNKLGPVNAAVVDSVADSGLGDTPASSEKTKGSGTTDENPAAKVDSTGNTKRPEDVDPEVRDDAERRRKEEIKAAARAYALSGSSSTVKKKGKQQQKRESKLLHRPRFYPHAAIPPPHYPPPYPPVSQFPYHHPPHHPYHPPPYYHHPYAPHHPPGQYPVPYKNSRQQPLSPKATTHSTGGVRTTKNKTVKTTVSFKAPPQSRAWSRLVPPLAAKTILRPAGAVSSPLKNRPGLVVTSSTTGNRSKSRSNNIQNTHDQDTKEDGDDEDLDDYGLFVRGLNVDEWKRLLDDDDDQEFQLQDGDEDEDEEEQEEHDDDDREEKTNGSPTTGAAPELVTYGTGGPAEGSAAMVTESSTKQNSEAERAGQEDAVGSVSPPSSSLDLLEWEPDFYQQLEEELGMLEEEDMEAAVATLLDPDHRYRVPAATNIETPASAEKGGCDLPQRTAPAGATMAAATEANTTTDVANQRTASSRPVGDQEKGKDDRAVQLDDDSVIHAKGRATQFRDLADSEMEAPVPGVTSPRDAKAAATASTSHRSVVSERQFKELHTLMIQHTQLLMQQTVLSVRAAHHHRLHRARDRSEYCSGESHDELAIGLDSAVGMLQDLDQNRKDAYRAWIQFAPQTAAQSQQNVPGIGIHESRGEQPPSKKRRLFNEPMTTTETHSSSSGRNGAVSIPLAERRLTRSQFSKTLQQQQELEQREGGQGTGGEKHKSIRTVFDIPGLSKLAGTFEMIDKSVEGIQKGQFNILEIETTKEAVTQVLSHAGVVCNKDFVPGERDLSNNFCDARESLGEDFKPPCTSTQELALRRNKNLFTAGEDNLVLRGVNLFGERRWMLIGDRYLPDRSDHVISQRYSNLCVLLYKAHGVKIDSEGNLEPAPKLDCLDDLDEEAIATLKPVDPPAVLNVHRWSLEEDLTLLKAVPLMGHMWAELGARLMPHRQRGHLRKRYQVLERRVKATMSRLKKKSTAERAPAAQQDHVKLRKNVHPLPPLQRQQDCTHKSAAVGPFAHLQPPRIATHPQPYYHYPHHYPHHYHNRAYYQVPNHPPPPPPPPPRERKLPSPQKESSPLANAQRMTDEDTERAVANAIVTQLAQSSPTLPIDVDHSNGGSSDCGAKSSTRRLGIDATAEEQATNSVSFLAGVLERTRQAEQHKASPHNQKQRKAATSSDTVPVAAQGSRSRAGESNTTPQKSTIYSTAGTPVGLSAAFRPSAGSDVKIGGSPTFSVGSLGQSLFGVFSHMSSADGREAEKCDPAAVFGQGAKDRNKIHFQGHEVARERSNWGATSEMPLSKNSDLPLFGEGATLMENDLEEIEAISALNSLSNSPGLSLLRQTSSNHESREVGQDNAGESKSLFAKVIGGISNK